jgi:hypothetical protein
MTSRARKPCGPRLDATTGGLTLLTGTAVDAAAKELEGWPIGVAARAAADARIALGLITRAASPFPGGLVKSAERRRTPVLLIIGDDPIDGVSLGPDGWLCARRLSGWARFALIHGAGGEASHYKTAVLEAELHRAAALIECSSETLPLWRDFLRAPHKLLIPPRAGVHPISPVLH